MCSVVVPGMDTTWDQRRGWAAARAPTWSGSGIDTRDDGSPTLKACCTRGWPSNTPRRSNCTDAATNTCWPSGTPTGRLLSWLASSRVAQCWPHRAGRGAPSGALGHPNNGARHRPEQIPAGHTVCSRRRRQRRLPGQAGDPATTTSTSPRRWRTTSSPTSAFSGLAASIRHVGPTS